MRKNLILIHDRKYIDDLTKNSGLIIGLNQEICNELKSKKIKYKSIEDYLPKDLDFKLKYAIPWIKRWSNQKVYKNKNFKEFFTYKRISLWWMMEFYLYQTSVFFKSYKNIIIWTEKLLKVLDKEKPDTLTFIEDKSTETEVLKAIAESKKIKTNTNIVIQAKIKKKVRDTVLPSIFVYYKIFRFLLRKYIWHLLELFDKRKKSKKKKILMFSEYAWGLVIDHITGSKKIDDQRFSALISQIKKEGKYDIVVSEAPIGFRLRLKHFIRRLRKFARYPPFEKYIAPTDFLTVIKIRNKLFKQYNSVKNKIIFQYKGIDLYNLLEPKLTFFFSKYILEILLFFKAINRELIIEKPNIIIISCEATPFGRIAIALSKLKGLKTIVVQHGAMCLHVDTVQSKKDISKRGKTVAPYFPMANLSLLYGEKDKQTLIDYNHYLPKWISTVGNLKYDSMNKYEEVYSRDRLVKKYNFDPSKKLVVLTSVPFHEDEDQEEFLTTVFSAIKKLDVNFIIKVHPNDKSLKIHKQIVDKIGLKNFKILKDVDTHELLYLSDIVITAYSTSAMDAIAFNKPVFIVDPTYNTYSKELISQKVAVPASSSIELASKIKKVINNGLEYKYIKAREKFIKSYLYQLDSRASERAIKYIELNIR